MTEPSNPSLRQRRYEKRTREILEAALSVLSEDGYAGSSMDRIAERALLTRVGLYKYFSDKPALVAALRSWKLDELAQRVQAALGNERRFEDRIRAVVRETLGFQKEHPGFFRLLFDANLSPDTSLKPYIEVVADALEQGVRSGAVRTPHALELAGLLATMAFEPSIKRNFVPIDEELAFPSHLGDLIADVFLRGVLV